MRIEILTSPGCAHGERTAAQVAEVAARLAPGAEIVRVQVESEADVARHAFPGSPTVRVDGVDVDPEGAARVGLG